MRNLTPPILDWDQILDNIINVKRWTHKATLTSMQHTIKEYYQKYREKRYTLEQLEHLTCNNDEKDAMKHTYTSRTTPLETLRSSILSIWESNICPYCNINSIATIDHYMPKDCFPEYSVLPINLVPCCRDCNHLKWEEWRMTSRPTLSIYFDHIPETQFLFVKIDIINWAIICKYYFNFDSNNVLSDTLNNHLEKLDLHSRYAKSINEHITEFIVSIAVDWNHSEMDIEYVRKKAYNAAKSKSDMKGVNYRQSVVFKEIWDNINICDRLLTKIKEKVDLLEQ